MNEPVTFKSAGDAIRITTFGNQMEKIDEENSDKNSSKIDSAFNSNTNNQSSKVVVLIMSNYNISNRLSYIILNVFCLHNLWNSAPSA